MGKTWKVSFVNGINSDVFCFIKVSLQISSFLSSVNVTVLLHILRFVPGSAPPGGRGLKYHYFSRHMVGLLGLNALAHGLS
jgi:hypothetical protein